MATPSRSFVRSIGVGFALCATATASAAPPMYAHFIDVGQGDATLLEFPCGAVLVDAGGQNSSTDDALFAYLDDFFARRRDLDSTLDVVFVTHTHLDHNRALRAIVEDGTARVERYVHNGILTGSGRAVAQWMHDHAGEYGITELGVSDSTITALSRRTGLHEATIDPLRCADVDPDIRVLSGGLADDPGWGAEFENGNNHSLVIRVEYGGASLLFTGDMEELAIETLVDYYTGTRLLDVDIYQVGHHGSHNGTTETLLDAMTPAIAVFSMGRFDDRVKWSAWAYGHPRTHAVELLEGAIARRREPRSVRVATGAKRFHEHRIAKAVYGTGWDGTVVVRATSEGEYTIRRSR